MNLSNAALKSHNFSSEDINITKAKVIARVKQNHKHDSEYSLEDKISIINGLCQFGLGRFLLQNQGLNGYWTHYILTHPWHGQKSGLNDEGKVFTYLERFLLDRSPVSLATQERFEIFLAENQKMVQDEAQFLCVPAGMMGELLYLNYEGVNKIKLYGVDLDEQTLKDAHFLANQKILSHFVNLINMDAWNINYENKFDLISSNGLNVYIPEKEKVISLYRKFYRALKPNGKLVTSFLTPPPTFTDNCEWDFNRISEDALKFNMLLINEIIGAKWLNFTSSNEMQVMLELVGFKDINIIYDKAKLFPTLTARK